MTACNKRPPPDHPMYNSGVACHMADLHDGGCTWALEPSKARQGLDKLLATFPTRELALVDSQPERPLNAYDVQTGEAHEITKLPSGPWVCVDFVGGDRYAIWKTTGAVYRVGPDGAVDEDPILHVQ